VCADAWLSLCWLVSSPRSGRGDKDVNTAIKALGMQTTSI
jgi:hypothetical protein